jgi:hypothetical protein
MWKSAVDRNSIRGSICSTAIATETTAIVQWGIKSFATKISGASTHSHREKHFFDEAGF